jgi:hypothetical protein
MDYTVVETSVSTLFTVNSICNNYYFVSFFYEKIIRNNQNDYFEASVSRKIENQSAVVATKIAVVVISKTTQSTTRNVRVVRRFP